MEIAGRSKSAETGSVPLVQQLVERVLGIGARLAPDHRGRGALHRFATAAHGLAVALHLQLLEVRGQAVQMLVVGQHRMIRGTQEVAVPDSCKCQQDRQVAIQGCAAEVLV